MKKILLTSLITLGLVSSGFTQNFWNLVNNSQTTYHFGMADDGTVYGATNQIFLYKSTTDGTIGSWDQLTGFPTTDNYNLFVKENTVFMLNGGGANFEGRGIYASTDGGDTWSTRNNGLGADTNMIEMHELANGDLLVGTRPAPNETKTFLSSDNGMTWAEGQTINGDIRSIVVVSANEAYMAAQNEIFKSTDNGQTWTNLNASFSSAPVKLIADNSGNLLGAASYEILESTDGGVTWTTKTTTGLPNLAGNLITTFRTLHDETIYISIDNDQGVFYSEDWGDTWTEITSNLTNTQIFNRNLAVSKTGYLFASPSGSGIYRSDDPVTASTVSLEQNKEDLSEIKLYPNPTSDKVFIKSEINDKGSLKIMNQFGQVVYSEKFESLNDFNNGIDISSFSTGIYFVDVKTSEGNIIQKLIKK
ncbi:MAG: T9SS type A sorting domain-containing protein [Brumimicrobium sp.]